MLTDNKTQIFRVTRRYWTNGAGSESLVLLVFAGLLLTFAGKDLYIPSLLMMFLAVLNIGLEVNTIRKVQIVINELEIGMQFKQYAFRATWESIKAVGFAGTAKEKRLIISCDDSGFIMPMKYFDEEEIAASLKEHLRPEVFEPMAHQRLSGFLEHQEDVIKRLSRLNDPLKVSLGKWERWVGIIGICVGLVIMLTLYLVGKIDTLELLLVGGIVGGGGLALIVLSTGWIEATNESITVRTLFSRRKFRWDLLEKVYVQQSYGWITLVGGKSRLILPSFSSLHGEDKDFLKELIALKLELSRIEPIETILPVYWRSKIVE